ncbi:hypothetical protein [Sphingomonas sp. 37zxx]|uniref:hypothetical protein n=1 Tax=Sphingomonas sp. 37zxx TaxID=1550073 RepID=UPI000A57EBBB|nr:hypothetical protein [Sphingomonas sp. 37zxx]
MRAIDVKPGDVKPGNAWTPATDRPQVPLRANGARTLPTGIDSEPVVDRRALIIEPEDSVRRSLQLMLQGFRFAVRSFGALAPALADSYARDAHVLLVAHDVLNSGDRALLSALRQSGWQGRAILVARSPTTDLADEARHAGFAAIVDKPIGRLELLNALSK